jgi:hypothetical protein
MAEHDGLVPAPRGMVSSTTCWMCGVRTGPGMMIADGGGACTDVRWYCLDVRGCTERWTSRRAGPADIRYGTAGGAEDAAQAAGLPRRHPVSTGTGPGYRSG